LSLELEALFERIRLAILCDFMINLLDGKIINEEKEKMRKA